MLPKGDRLDKGVGLQRYHWGRVEVDVEKVILVTSLGMKGCPCGPGGGG